jgi:hypothetical protein
VGEGDKGEQYMKEEGKKSKPSCFSKNVFLEPWFSLLRQKNEEWCAY